MLELVQVASTNFVLLQPEWDLESSHNLVARLGPTHLIVHANGNHYLLKVGEAESCWAGKATATPICKALGLERLDPVRALDTHVDIDTEEIPDRCVMLDADGHVAGFFDASVPPEASELDRLAGRAVSPDAVPRTLMAEMPDQVALHKTASLQVWLSLPGQGAGVEIDLPDGSDIDLIVQAQRGFAVEGDGKGRLTVSETGPETRIDFVLRPTGLGRGLLRVLAFHRGQPLVTLDLAPMVVDDEAPMPDKKSQYKGTVMPARVQAPDLTLLILETPVDGKTCLSLYLTAADPDLGLNQTRFGPVQLCISPNAFFSDLFQDLEDLPLATPEDRAVANLKLAAKGQNLFTALFPQSLQETLWKLRGQIHSVQIQSEEPWIPWEICKLTGSENGQIVEGPFFAEAFAVTRWLPGVPRRPSLSLRKLALVVPSGSGLPSAPAEREFIRSLAGSDRDVTEVPATFLEVQAALAQGTYDGWHFTGHGAANDRNADRSVILLDHQKRLTPEDLSGVVRNLGASRPLVFLNACQTGRAGLSLTGIGGWAKSFLGAGAAAFVGTHWAVKDQAAAGFAQSFYQSVLRQETIGEAVRQARLAIRTEGDPTWLAYTVYADTLLALNP